MNNKFIETITFSKLNSIIMESKKNIIFSSANLHEEVAHSLFEAAQKGVEVIVIIDPSEDNYRHGMGDIKSIDLLKRASVKICEIIGNQVSFIIADELGYIIFPQSKIFIDEPKGPNAIFMDDILKYKIKAHYFPPKDKVEKSKFIDEVLSFNEIAKKEINSITTVIQENKSEIEIKKLDDKKFEEVKENLRNNPPIHPDVKRKIETHTKKKQFVELKFEGAKFHTKKISIPKDALPYKDAELKNSLETKLNLFTNMEDNDDIKRFNLISKQVENLRLHSKIQSDEYYLIPITCRKNKSIINKSKKKEFKEKIASIEKDIGAFRKSTLESLEKEILNRKDAIKKALLDFLKENPPANYQNYSLDLFSRKIADQAQDIVSKIKFPEVKDLLSGLELKYNFYDLTYEDFSDKELIEEFRDKGILGSDELNEIVSFKDAFEAAK